MAGIPLGMAIANAHHTSGLVVKVSADALLVLLSRTRSPLVVTAKAGLLKSKYKYLTSYKGLNFYTESSEPISLPADAEIVTTDNLSIPD